LTPRKYFVLLGIAGFGAIGDTLLSRGMKAFGSVSPGQIAHLLVAVLNPFVFVGIFFLLAFMAVYLTALSWADLTYVLPATAFGYVFIALIARFFLHEHISPLRWLGILLISAGVGFVTGGPESSSTKHIPEQEHAVHRLSVGVKSAGVEP
jgi:drug/metabolite transporter (DMT)-like permease